MLQEVLVSPTAKLDISRLLKSSVSPSPPPPSTTSLPSFSRSFSMPSVETDPRVRTSPTTSPTSYFPTSNTGPGSLDARRPAAGGPQASLAIPALSTKRNASTSPQESHHSNKKPTRQWSEADSDKLIRLRNQGTHWGDIARQFEGRTQTACRLRFQNYLEKKYNWDAAKKAKLAGLYDRQKEAMWKNIAEELNIPWRAVEDMHWMLGQEEMANLAGGHLLHGPKRSGSNRDSSGTSILSGPSPSDAPHAMHTGWMSTPSSTFSRLPSYPGTMLAQAPQPATTNGTAPPRAMVGGEETGFGFHRTSRRQSSSSGQFPSVAELERGITAYAAQARNRYRGEDEEEGAREEEMEEDVVRRRR